MLEIKNAKEAQLLLQQAIEQIKVGVQIGLHKSLHQASVFAAQDIKDHFKKEEGFDGKWKPFKYGGRLTWTGKEFKIDTTAHLLSDIGKMKNSISYAEDYSNLTLRITSAMPYSAIHQYGGTVSIPAMTKPHGSAFVIYAPAGEYGIAAGRATKTKRIKGGAKLVTSLNFLFRSVVKAHTVTIPARPYLWLSDNFYRKTQQYIGLQIRREIK